MIEIGKRDIERIGKLVDSVHQVDNLRFSTWFAKEPRIARAAIIETARVLMAAKCLAITPDDKAFYKQCTSLVVLTLEHPEITAFFVAISNIDLGTAFDRLHDPCFSMARYRIDSLKNSLG